MSSIVRKGRSEFSSSSNDSGLKDEFTKCNIILEGFKKNPQCQHGPTVLFSRGDRKFFACSAYRSRHLCPFYLDFEDFKRPKTSKKDKKPSSHKIDNSSLLQSISNPENNQGQAQFFFSDETLKFLLKLLKSQKITQILCMGVPTIHEKFQGSSYLLDIDRKFETTQNCTRYNMCNHYFFTDNFNYCNHLKASKNLVVICDPPFGARLELIFNTFKLIAQDWMKFKQQEGKIHFILINPYFAEGKILNLNPKFRMSDYKIEYASHKKFKKGYKSPVRLFTTLNLGSIILPSPDYKHCSTCNKYVLSVSKHCKICGTCDSRDGKVYHHCKKCRKCVKETWSHCGICRLCHLRGECGEKQNNSKKRKVS